MNPDGYVSFVVRFWHDPAGHAPCERWQGEIEHIQSGVRWSFSTLIDLLAFLHQVAATPHSILQFKVDVPDR